MLDLDGTLLNSASHIMPRTASKIKELERRGVEIVIATGRSRKGILHKIGSLADGKYLVCFNGSASYDPNGNLIDAHFLPEDVIKPVIAEMRKHRNVQFHAHTKDEFIYAEQFYGDNPRHRFSNGTYCELVDFDTFDHFTWYKAIFIDPDHDKLSRIHDALYPVLEGKCSFLFTRENALELFPLGINKATGVGDLLRSQNKTFKTTMAFGDSANDFEILHAVEHPVVMVSGDPELKNEGFHVTRLGNDEDGIADYIESLPDDFFYSKR